VPLPRQKNRNKNMDETHDVYYQNNLCVMQLNKNKTLIEIYSFIALHPNQNMIAPVCLWQEESQTKIPLNYILIEW